MALACRNGRRVLVLECHFQKGLFFMNYFYKIMIKTGYSIWRCINRSVASCSYFVPGLP